MPTPKEEATVPLEVGHFTDLMQDMNARIARLSIALSIPLETDADIQRAIHAGADMPTPAIERRSGTERRTAQRAIASIERRTNWQRSELRGLLVLRYETELKMVQVLGGTTSRQVMGSMAQNMERHGFKPGADGLPSSNSN